MKTLTLVLLFLLSALPARATPIQYVLQDVRLSDGGMVTGGFTFDADRTDAYGMRGDAISSLNIVVSGYAGPGITHPEISTQSYSLASAGFMALQTELTYSTIPNCYNDLPNIVSPAPCYTFSDIFMTFSDSLATNPAKSLVGGYFDLQCSYIICPSDFGRYGANIVSGYVCTETPCPGGPIVQVPEPSSLESILMGFFMVVIWIGKKLKVDIGL